MGKSVDLETTLVGVAGEYFVAAELSLRGFLATITLRNSRGIDIIASNGDASRSVSIQVKTCNGASPTWILSKKAESFSGAGHFYVFVRLEAVGSRPDYHIVPSSVVADRVKQSHAAWLAGAKADGTRRKDSSLRKFDDLDHEFREAWSVLGL
jgi:hypothetical protein